MSSRSAVQKRPRHEKAWSAIAALAITLALGGCGPNRFETRSPAWGDTLRGAADTAVSGRAAEDATAVTPAQTNELLALEQDPDFYRPGSDLLVRTVRSVADAQPQPGGSIKLNFQSTNLLEVIKIILGDVLQRNYVVDAEVQGVVSMQTTRSLRQEDLLPTLELMLRMNNAALIYEEDLLRIVPLPDALAQVRVEQLGDSALPLPPGFRVRVVPLRYIAAEEMAQIVAPFVADGNQLLRVDSTRNLLVLASAGGQMNNLLETIDTFDVDSMSGMSVALFTPDFVDAKTLAEELEELLANPEYGLMRGLVRFVVVERLNGLMVVTPRAEHLARVRDWIRRLDRNTGDATPRLFIYRVQNGKAKDLAEVLRDLFEEPEDEPVELAPGLSPTTLGDASASVREGESEEARQRADENTPNPPAGSLAGGIAIEPSDKIQIIADEANNALLILAKGTEYRQILTALRQLDVSPQQVLIEVTIAQVRLTDALEFGVEWFFKNNVGSYKGEGVLDLGEPGLNALTGFSYALKGPDVRFVLNALATETNLSILSSPSLLVLNNQEASIQVGEEVPLATQERQSTTDADSPLVNTIEYRDTGVLLTVKPRVNSGGLVIMEVEQEVSNVPTTTEEDTLTPRIQQRRISSTVAINSGDTIILGGLIQENRDLSESGVPLLHKVPVLGALFGTKQDNQERTELIVLITPQVISNSTAALQVTEDYRRRLKRLIPTSDRGLSNQATEAAAAATSPVVPGEMVRATPPATEPEAQIAATAVEQSTPPVKTSLAAAPPIAQTTPPPPATEAMAAAASGWGVQVGAFRDPQAAERLVTKLRDSGISTEAPKRVEVGDTIYYRVHAGPTVDRDQAQMLIPRIQAAAGVNGMIVHHQ